MASPKPQPRAEPARPSTFDDRADDPLFTPDGLKARDVPRVGAVAPDTDPPEPAVPPDPAPAPEPPP